MLNEQFYIQDNVVQIAQDLLGKILVTNIDGQTTSSMIVETEAYAGVNDKASHAYNGRRTKRTETMYAKGGVAYVYLCYGIHHLFNIVTNIANVPHAILIRGAEPIDGIDIMMKRRGVSTLKNTLTAGPGSLSKAMGINTNHTGLPLYGSDIFIEDRGIVIRPEDIIKGTRVGVAYAKQDALLPYRFWLNDNKYVSKAKGL